MNNFIDVVRACEKKKGSTLESGDKRQTFGDDVTHPSKYNCFGVQASRAKTSVTAVPSFIKSRNEKQGYNHEND